MNFLGYGIGDWVGLATLTATLVSLCSWLFKKIALDPLREDIKDLGFKFDQRFQNEEKVIDDILNTQKVHSQELGSHSTRLTRLEDHVGIKGEDNHED
ncbi:MAG: hypothetical protein LKJ69_01470 [Lactobacillus sp.]|nr:hypothetical protein [Lactobacillus sp.]MCI2032052.1 hypothetical protein [Lactobacillus sp.]